MYECCHDLSVWPLLGSEKNGKLQAMKIFIVAVSTAIVALVKSAPIDYSSSAQYNNSKTPLNATELFHGINGIKTPSNETLAGLKPQNNQFPPSFSSIKTKNGPFALSSESFSIIYENDSSPKQLPEIKAVPLPNRKPQTNQLSLNQQMATPPSEIQPIPPLNKLAEKQPDSPPNVELQPKPTSLNQFTVNQTDSPPNETKLPPSVSQVTTNHNFTSKGVHAQPPINRSLDKLHSPSVNQQQMQPPLNQLNKDNASLPMVQPQIPPNQQLKNHSNSEPKQMPQPQSPQPQSPNQLTKQHGCQPSSQQDATKNNSNCLPKQVQKQHKPQKLPASKANEIGFNDKYLASQNKQARHRNVIFDGVAGDVMSFSNYHVLGHQEVFFGSSKKKQSN